VYSVHGFYGEFDLRIGKALEIKLTFIERINIVKLKSITVLMYGLEINLKIGSPIL